MSFNLDFLAKMGASFNTKVGSIYKYDGIEAGDDLATITATNYFLSRKASLRIRDMMEIVATDTNATYIVTALDPDVVLAEFASGQSDFITSVDATNLVVTSGELNTIQDINPSTTPQFATIKLNDFGIIAGPLVYVKLIDGTLGIDVTELFYDEAKKALAVGTTDVAINVNGQTKNAGFVAVTETGADKYGVLSKYFGVTNTAALTMAYARGSEASPGTVSAGDMVSKICTVGLKESGIYGEAAVIEVVAGDDFTPTETRGLLVFKTTSPSMTTANTKMTLSDAGALSISSATATASAQLDVVSTTKGFLPPRMTDAQRDAISTPADGLMIYNTTTNKGNIRENGAWRAITTTAV